MSTTLPSIIDASNSTLETCAGVYQENNSLPLTCKFNNFYSSFKVDIYLAYFYPAAPRLILFV